MSITPARFRASIYLSIFISITFIYREIVLVVLGVVSVFILIFFSLWLPGCPAIIFGPLIDRSPVSSVFVRALFHQSMKLLVHALDSYVSWVFSMVVMNVNFVQFRGTTSTHEWILFILFITKSSWFFRVSPLYFYKDELNILIRGKGFTLIGLWNVRPASVYFFHDTVEYWP